MFWKAVQICMYYVIIIASFLLKWGTDGSYVFWDPVANLQEFLRSKVTDVGCKKCQDGTWARRLIMVVKSEPLGDRHIKSRLLRGPPCQLQLTQPTAASSVYILCKSSYPATPPLDCMPQPTEDDIEPLLEKPNCCIFYHSATEQPRLKLNQ